MFQQDFNIIHQSRNTVITVLYDSENSLEPQVHILYLREQWLPQKVEVLCFTSCPGVLAQELSIRDSSGDERLQSFLKVWCLESSCSSIFPEQLWKGHFSFSSWCPFAKAWVGYTNSWLFLSHKASDRIYQIRSNGEDTCISKGVYLLFLFAQWLVWFQFTVLPKRYLCTASWEFSPVVPNAAVSVTPGVCSSVMQAVHRQTRCFSSMAKLPVLFICLLPPVRPLSTICSAPPFQVPRFLTSLRDCV